MNLKVYLIVFSRIRMSIFDMTIVLQIQQIQIAFLANPNAKIISELSLLDYLKEKINIRNTYTRISFSAMAQNKDNFWHTYSFRDGKKWSNFKRVNFQFAKKNWKDDSKTCFLNNPHH